MLLSALAIRDGNRMMNYAKSNDLSTYIIQACVEFGPHLLLGTLEGSEFTYARANLGLQKGQ